MARKKKRNKKYQGEDAKQNAPSVEPTIHRYEAVQRSALGEWWQTKKRIARPVAIAVGIAIVVIWLIVEVIRMIF